MLSCKKLILNDIEYNHFTISVPISGVEARIMTKGLRYSHTEYLRRASELASVIIFADKDKITVSSEWVFESENMETTDNTIVIRNASLVEAL